MTTKRNSVVLTSKYRPPYKRYTILGAGVIAAIILGWLYVYGAPIGYEVIGTTLSGKEVKLGPDQVEVHLAYTPLYSAAMQWRNFVNVAWQYIALIASALGTLRILFGDGRKILSYLLKFLHGAGDSSKGSKGFPPKSPPYGGIGSSS